MKVALVVPGGVDRSGERRVIPVFLALIGRVARVHEVHVFTRRQEPDVGSWSLCGARVRNAGGSAFRLMRDITGEHRRAPFDVVQALFGGGDALLAIAAARWARAPVAVHLAGGELVAMHDIGYGGRRYRRGRWVQWLALHGANALTAASTPMVDAIADLGVRARRLPLGVDRECWPERPPRPRQPRERLRLVHVASLNAVKDQPTLLLALARLAEAGCEFEADIVGEDTLSGEVQRRAQSLGLGGHIRFHGFRTQRELQNILSAAHLHLVSSRHEAGPVALLEAAHAGVPTVGTRVGHVAEWSPTAALAVPVGDARALAAAVSTLYHDDARRLALAREAQRRALSEDADFTARAFERMWVQLRCESGRQPCTQPSQTAGDPGTARPQGVDESAPPSSEQESSGNASPDRRRLPST